MTLTGGDMIPGNSTDRRNIIERGKAMCGCFGGYKCLTHRVIEHETCDVCRGARFIATTVVTRGFAYPAEYPCGRCRGTGLVEVAA